jgi:methanogen homocitrate synthase
VEAGAETVHTNILGLGERSGGTATEEIAVALEFLYDIRTNLNLEKFFEVSQVVQEISGIVFPGHKPVVGRNSFSYEAGIAAMFSYRLFNKDFPLGVIPYLADKVGNKFNIALGKKSGKYNVLWHLENREKNLKDEYLQDIVDKIKIKSINKKSALTIEEFNEILDEM